MSLLGLGEGGDCGDLGDGTDNGESGDGAAGESVFSGKRFSSIKGFPGWGKSTSPASIRGGSGSGLISSNGTSPSGVSLSVYPYKANKSSKGISLS